LARGVRSARRAPTETEETIYKAQSKGAYALAYGVGAMLINGIITYSSTGNDPEGMDWILPRTGRDNPDGTPHRITNMFYTRELPMVEKHVENAGSIVGGIADTLYGKMVIAPFVEMARNRDYYGNEIMSEGSPLYKKGWQALQHVSTEQLSPISVTGAQQAMKTGGGWDEAALAVLGFGPAPSYANKTATQNLVEHLFQEFVAPAAKPEEMGAQAKTRGDIRTEILLAQQRGDQLSVQAGAQKWFKAGGSRQGLSNILLHIPPDVSMFRALPEVAQQRVMQEAPAEESTRYRPYLKSDVAGRVADLQSEAMAAAGAGDQVGAAKIADQIQQVMSDAVHSGRITNLGEFMRSVQQNMMFRQSPEAAAQKGDVSRQRRLMMQPATP
jgi:hypothetical protein